MHSAADRSRSSLSGCGHVRLGGHLGKERLRPGWVASRGTTCSVRHRSTRAVPLLGARPARDRSGYQVVMIFSCPLHALHE